MSLYHEAVEILSVPGLYGGNLKSRVFGKKGLKSNASRLYALALETCKWSSVLKEVIENSEILTHERKLTPILSLLLVHDFLLAKGGIALPQTHGLRIAIERHKARLTSEFTRARLRRKVPSVEALRAQLDSVPDVEGRYPRWVRVNTLWSELERQLESTFAEFEQVYSIQDVINRPGKSLYIDSHIPKLVAVSPGVDLTKTEAYQGGAIILQDKASCFPAYLLDPRPEDGDVIDSCAAPGNKTTHLAAILASHQAEVYATPQTIFAFEKDDKRASTLEKMVKKAGAKKLTRIGFGQDFLKVNPLDERYKNVGALLLDPSCSGSGIVGRDTMPELHLPEVPDKASSSKGPKEGEPPNNRKRKREEDEDGAKKTILDDDGNATVLASEQELEGRLKSLAKFQLTLLLHAFKFPAAKKITYSTCSVHAEENEQVVLAALQSDIAKERGWRILEREHQVRGMREWEVRGSVDACGDDVTIADACIRSYKDDGRGVMGFFVAGFVRDAEPMKQDDDGPYVRDQEGRIIRDVLGMPVLKSTGLPVAFRGHVHEDDDSDDSEESEEDEEEGANTEDEDSDEASNDDDGGDNSDQEVPGAGWQGFED